MKKWILILMSLALGAVLFYRMRPHPSNIFSGTVEMTEHSVGARAAGRLTQLVVDEGDPVKKGQLLGTLDRYEQAQRDDRRTLDLYRHGGTTHQALENAELALQDQEIISPVDGIVLLKIHETGEIVLNGQAVVTLGERNDIWVRIFVPEGMISRLRMNQPATIHIDGLQQPFPGHVSFISPTAEFTPRNVQSPDERVTQTFAVKVKLDQAPDYLRPGVSGDVTFL